MKQSDVFDAITKERAYQDEKWGSDKPQSLPGFLIILEEELAEVKKGWVKNLNVDLNEIVQIAAIAVACLEKYGVNGSATATDDISNE